MNQGSKQYDQQLARGALINLLGLVAKLVHPLFFLVITWFFGPDTMGLYQLVVLSLAEVANSFVATGFQDAVMVYGSHHADDPGPVAEAKLYRVLGNCFAFGVGASALLVGLTYLGADLLVEHVYPERPEIAPALRVLCWSLPAMALSQIAIGATKARMHMQYDALINGLVKPLSLLGFSLLAYFVDAGLQGLMLAQVATYLLQALLSLWALQRHFDLGRVWQATAHLQPDRMVLRFAIPQALNMTANKFLTRVDVLLLGAFGYSNAQLAFYGAGALITTNLREVKLIFAGALAPVAARHHASGDRQSFEDTLGKVSRWTTSIAVPAVLAVAVLRSDLMLVVHESYTGDTTFMLWLLVPPFLSCAYGLAGNCIVYTGHTTYTLFNSLLVAGLNTAFNWLMIPHWGLTGSAAATAIASLLVSLLQVVELQKLEKVHLRWAAVWHPHVGMLLGMGVLAVLWDPAELSSLVARIGVAVGVAVLYGLFLYATKHPEMRAIVGRLTRRSSGAGA